MFFEKYALWFKRYKSIKKIDNHLHELLIKGARYEKGRKRLTWHQPIFYTHQITFFGEQYSNNNQAFVP